MSESMDVPAGPSEPNNGSIGQIIIRRGRRSRAQVEAERQKLRAEIEAGVDPLVAEMHARLPRAQAAAVGVAYARYSTEFQSSVLDQLRGIFERSVAMGVFIPRDHVFYDLSVSGSKERRPGLDGVRQVLAERKAKVLVVFTTNRLFRRMHKAMKFVEEEIHERKLRAVFVKSNIDTQQGEQWRLPLQINTMIDEVTSTMYASNIRAAHEGLFVDGYVVFTLPYGYAGLVVPGKLTKRQRPRQKAVIDEETGPWVQRIYHWFVVDRLPKQVILERLNSLKVPCGPMSDGSFWTVQALDYLLRNECYRGLWSYGKGQNIWQSAADYSKRVLREKPLVQKTFEHLRLVSDEVWYAAQKLLDESAENYPNAGRKPVDGKTETRPRFLNGLLRCYHHRDARLKVAGDHGQYMVCMRCRTLPKKERPIYSYLQRQDALRAVCGAIANIIRGTDGLVDRLLVPFQEEARALQTQAKGDVTRHERKVKRLTERINFILANPGETEKDKKESHYQLKKLRAERADEAAVVADFHARQYRKTATPTVEEFQSLVDEFEQVFVEAASSPEPADAATLRSLLELVTGGKIVVEQAGERRHSRGWCRLRFTVNLLPALCAKSERHPPADGEPQEVVVDLRPQSIAERKQADVITLYKEGKLITDIARIHKMQRCQVRAAVKRWCDAEGVPFQDGRVRRALVPNKLLAPGFRERNADEAKRLYDEGLLIDQIAARLGCIRDTARSTLKHWFDKHGLPMPDGRSRRKLLAIKNRPAVERIGMKNQESQTRKQEGESTP